MTNQQVNRWWVGRIMILAGRTWDGKPSGYFIRERPTVYDTLNEAIAVAKRLPESRQELPTVWLKTYPGVVLS